MTTPPGPPQPPGPPGPPQPPRGPGQPPPPRPPIPPPFSSQRPSTQRPAAPKPTPRPKGAGSPILTGVFAAVICGVVWGVVAIIFRVELGWLAWGVGAVVGGAVGKHAADEGRPLGTQAALFAIVGILLGKVLIVEFGVRPGATRELTDDPDFLAQALMVQMQERREFSAPINAQLDRLGPQDTLPDRLWFQMMDEATTRVDAASPEERERMARSFVESSIMSLGFVELFKAQFEFLDAIFFFLAIGTAWKLGNRG